jgi:hypothetical protein
VPSLTLEVGASETSLKTCEPIDHSLFRLNSVLATVGPPDCIMRPAATFMNYVFTKNDTII